MNTVFRPILERYNYLNQYASSGQILFFGSSYLDQFPLYELKEDYHMDQTIFKRTIAGLSIQDAFECLDTCVFDLLPSKLFLSFGDDDLNDPFFSVAQFIAHYRKLLIQIAARMPKCEIYLLGVQSPAAASALNLAIAELAREYQCEFISFDRKAASPNFTAGSQNLPYAEDFRHIKVFLHPERISFSQFWDASYQPAGAHLSTP